MATLVNGNGNPAVYAQQDADLYVGVMGTTSCIMSVGSKFAATIETANLISVADGVILTKEGRRIQTDVGEVDEFNIPNGAAGVTRYYIIGYHLYTDGQGSQKCETFVQLMSSATDTIPEAEFRNGATEVYVSLYRVTQVGLTLNDPESLLPDALNIGDINASLTELNTIKYDESDHYIKVKIDDDWIKFMHFDPTEVVALVPTMTSDTTPEGYGNVISNATYASGYAGYRAFDNNTTTAWKGNSTSGAYLGFKFLQPKTVSKVFLSNKGNQNNAYFVGDFKVQGSNDGQTWYDVSGVLSNQMVANYESYYTFENYNPYTYWCVKILTRQSANEVDIGGLQFYGY